MARPSKGDKPEKPKAPRKPRAKKERKALAKVPAAPEQTAGQQQEHPRRPGRPSDYTTEIGNRICELVADRVAVFRIVQMEGMPDESTLYRWRRNIPEFRQNYARAREERADARQDRIDFIAEQCGEGALDPQIARVMIDAEKWQMGKEQPKRYGDKVEIDTPEDSPIAKAVAVTMAALAGLAERKS